MLPERASGYRLPVASRFKPAVSDANLVRVPASARIEARHEMILRLVEQSGRVLPYRPMARLLSENGFAVSFVQVAKDYQTLRLESQRTKRLLQNRTASTKYVTLKLF